MIEANRIPRLRLVGVAKSSAAYELRDPLQRSVVAFDGSSFRAMRTASSSLIENYMGFPGGISGAERCERGGQQAHSESRS
jgi:thioredoxin reductase